MQRTRRTQTLLLPRGAQIKIEYNPRRPSIRTIVRQVEALGYTVLVRPFQGRREKNSQGFLSQCVGAHLLLIYPPPFNNQRNEEEIAREQNDQVHIKSVEVEITDDLFKNSVVPLLEIEDKDSPIEYQGAIINWLQREYGEHLEVIYSLYEEYLAARNEGRHCYPTHRASLSNLILLNPVIKHIVHDDVWYLPENPEFDYECLINICGSMLCFQIPGTHHEFQGRRIL
jgi:hypothetical protein